MNGAVYPEACSRQAASAGPLSPPWLGAVAVTLLALAASCRASDAQAGAPLALADCIDLALAHNLQYRADKQGFESSRAGYELAQAPFATDVRLNVTGPSFSETRDTFESEALIERFREQNTTLRYQTGLELSRRIRRVGRFSVSTTGFRHEFDSNRREDFREYFGDVRVEYQRDLMSTPADEIAVRQAELDLAISQSALERRRLQLEQEVADVFFDLIQSIRQLEIQQQRVDQAGAALRLAARKFELGIVAEVEALRLEVEKRNAEAAFAKAETEIERRRDILRDLLGLDLEEPLELVTQVRAEQFAIDGESAVRAGLANRSDILESELRERLQSLDLKRRREQSRMQAALTAGMTLRGRGPDLGDVADTFERSLVRASVNVELPVIDSGWRRGLVRQGETAAERSRLERQMRRRAVVLEIRDALRNLREAERQIDLRQASLEVTERQYDVVRRRFELGSGDSQELLDAQTTLTSARTEALDAVIDYRRALQTVRLATMSELSELVAAERRE